MLGALSVLWHWTNFEVGSFQRKVSVNMDWSSGEEPLEDRRDGRRDTEKEVEQDECEEETDFLVPDGPIPQQRYEIPTAIINERIDSGHHCAGFTLLLT